MVIGILEEEGYKNSEIYSGRESKNLVSLLKVGETQIIKDKGVVVKEPIVKIQALLEAHRHTCEERHFMYLDDQKYHFTLYGKDKLTELVKNNQVSKATKKWLEEQDLQIQI